MDTSLPSDPQFDSDYKKHFNCLKLNGLQPKTIDAYLRAIRRIGNYFNCQINDLSPDQLLDYFTELLDSHSWSAVKLEMINNCKDWPVSQPFFTLTQEDLIFTHIFMS